MLSPRSATRGLTVPLPAPDGSEASFALRQMQARQAVAAVLRPKARSRSCREPARRARHRPARTAKQPQPTPHAEGGARVAVELASEAGPNGDHDGALPVPRRAGRGPLLFSGFVTRTLMGACAVPDPHSLGL